MLNLVKPISKKCLPMLALESHNCFCLLTYRDKSKNTLTVAGNTSGRRSKIFGEGKYLVSGEGKGGEYLEKNNMMMCGTRNCEDSARILLSAFATSLKICKC